ncbi:hypothetical protein [Myxosarcina sp. GI1]|uniref:hypothetical protein n=1 Tax=Myxosarcina sp. GI1 TaxID=1541065 RepID=UPI00055AA761|nr:hypothetical protein [Myxosarcina sp. GI1]
MVFSGWEVSRVIPHDTIVGLITGQYKLHGGVIRWAAGTSNAGQIVKHLMPVASNSLNVIPGLNFVPGIVANIQLEQLKNINQFNTHQLMKLSGQIGLLSQATSQVLQIATGTALLSGLGLTVSCIGFASINKKLNTIDTTLKKIQQDVQAIKYFLESSERARLYAALHALLKIDNQTALEHRHTILHSSRNTLAEINMRYRELLSEANTIETAMTYEEYFSLTALAQVRCTAELEMLDIAHKEIEELVTFWQSQANRIAKELLIGDYPERFLATDFANDVSVTELVQWLDFIYDENKGSCWIDELRVKINETWYSEDWFSKTKSTFFSKDKSKIFSDDKSGLNKNIGIGIEKERNILIPATRKLIARSAVFEDYNAQYNFFKTQKIKPSDFEQKLIDVPETSLIEGYLILEPTQNKTLEVTI